MISISKAGSAVRPTSGWLNVNRACNLRCEWCYAKGTNYKVEDEMSLELAVRLVGLMQSQGVTNVTLIGGEPTLWDPLFEFNRHCSEIGMRSTLVTNATRFGVDSFWEAYRKSPSSNVSLSVKGFDEASFRCVTNTTAFLTTKRGIERALSLEASHANVVYMGEDPNELVELARFAASCGARSLGISPSTLSFVQGKPDILNASDPRRFIANFVECYDELDELFQGRISVAIKLPLCLWPRNFIVNMMEKSQIMTTCQLQHRSGLLFAPDGSVISCNSLHDFPLGKLDHEFDDPASLTAHLESAPVVDFYDRVATYASPKCVTCTVRAYCGGGCPLHYGAADGSKLIPGWDPVPTLSEGVDHVRIASPKDYRPPAN